MAIKFEKIQPGMTLWITERTRQGNTARRVTVARRLSVVEVDSERRRVLLQTGSLKTWRSEREMRRYSAKDPRSTCCGNVGRHSFDCSSLTSHVEP